MTLNNSVQSEQERSWSGKIGAAYTDRNTLSAEGLDTVYSQNFGRTRTELNWQFVGSLPRYLRILEVGCNIGMQLRHLRAMGFYNLWGIELQQYALDRLCVSGVEVCQGSVTALPYPDEDFELVYTSGLLIHIPPDDLPQAMSEILRCTKQWVWGFEYYSQTLREISHRSWKDMLWEGDYPRMFIEMLPSLEVKDRWAAPDMHPDRAGTLVDMYLLEKP